MTHSEKLDADAAPKMDGWREPHPDLKTIKTSGTGALLELERRQTNTKFPVKLF